MWSGGLARETGRRPALPFPGAVEGVVDPGHRGEGGRPADCRDGEDGGVEQFVASEAGVERMAGGGVNGALVPQADGHGQLHQAACLLIQRPAGFMTLAGR